MQGADIPLTTEGALTIGTGNPAYAPWYGGKSVDGSEWESSSFTGDPHSGEGYESAFAYALAGTMGFDDDAVEWVGIPFAKSFAPGPRDFDFAMQQISYSDKRAEAVDFSDGYFDVNQALIANDGSPAIGATTLDGLKDAEARRPDRHHEPAGDRGVRAAHRRARRLRRPRPRPQGPQERPARRRRGRLPDRVLRLRRRRRGPVPRRWAASRSTSGSPSRRATRSWSASTIAIARCEDDGTLQDLAGQVAHHRRRTSRSSR